MTTPSQTTQTLEAGDLIITLDYQGDHCAARFHGRIDERIVTLLSEFAEQIGAYADSLSLDLERVHFINSVGVREWIKLMRALGRKGVRIRLERCSEPMIHQMNMIVEAVGVAEVASFYAPYQCTACGYEGSMCIEVAAQLDALKARTAPEQSCPECAGAMELMELPQRYFQFLEELPKGDQ